MNNNKDKDVKSRKLKKEEERDLYLPGSADLKRLSRGITEDGPDEDCLVDDELSDDNYENDDDCLIPLNWAEIASCDKVTKNKIREAILESRRANEPSIDAFIDVDAAIASKLSDRLVKITDRNPDFLRDLAWLLVPVAGIEKPHMKVVERRNSSPNPLLNVTREQARAWAAALGFFGWGDFLLKLNAIEAAKKGNIHKGKS